jgi:DNA-binding response OmpR family regulator
MFRVLVIEDDEKIKRLVGLVLAKNGYDVRSVSSVEEAVSYFSDDWKPHVCVIDKMLPGMSGDEFIRNFPWEETGTVPILMTAAKLSQDQRASVLDDGALYVLNKPFSMDELVSMIRKATTVSE